MEQKSKLDSKELMYSQGKNDECYTPDYGVESILVFIPKGKNSKIDSTP